MFLVFVGLFTISAGALLPSDLAMLLQHMMVKADVSCCSKQSVLAPQAFGLAFVIVVSIT